MLDFFNILNTPGVDIQYFEGDSQGTNLQVWQTWRKPRGARLIYMLGVGAGGSGSCGLNTSTSGGGGGGGSGAQASVCIPAIFVPDILYVQCGVGGIPTISSGAAGVNGSNTYIAIEPYTTFNGLTTFLLAQSGSGGGASSTTNGGTGGTWGAASTISQMCLAAKGLVTLIDGGVGGNGRNDTNSGGATASGWSTTGLIVSGGAG